MLNIRTIVLSVAVVAVLMLTVQLVNAGTEVVFGPSSDPVIALDHQDRYDKMNKVPIPSYRSPVDECFDVPVAEAAACHTASRLLIPTYRSPLDACFDVPLREVASCRE